MIKKESETIILKPVEILPVQSSDLFCPTEHKLVAVVSTLKNEREQPGKEKIEPGITLCEEDKIWDIVVDKPEITKEVIREAVSELSKKTGVSYIAEFN